jgi:hypothetical protein
MNMLRNCVERNRPPATTLDRRRIEATKGGEHGLGESRCAASSNIGCMTPLSDAIGIPFAHTVELLDWATGGPEPDALRKVRPRNVSRDAA